MVSVSIPGSVKKIGKFSFAENELETLVLNEGIEEIEERAFFCNLLTSVCIASSVKKIGFCAFDNMDIKYDDLKIPREFIVKFGTEAIITIYNMSKVVSLSTIYKVPKSIMDIIPEDNDSIKAYFSNHKKFDDLIDFAASHDWLDLFEKDDLFKFCFILGYFHHYSKELEAFIKKVIDKEGVSYIHLMTTSIQLDTYDPKFREVFIKLYNENHILYNNTSIIDRVYNAFPKIKKYTLKRHEEEISKKNTELKRSKEQGDLKRVDALEQELILLKKKKKEINYNDILHYIENHTFDIKEENESLRSVEKELSIHMEQDGFNRIQDMYEKSVGVEKSIPFSIDKRDASIKYLWAKSDNPINTILGYLVNCCAKLDGAGEDIMIESMINPNVINLIINDEYNQVLGKATAYHNEKEKYILFNNIETKEIKDLQNKSDFVRKQESLLAILEAVKEVKEKSNIKEVRIGMKRNDLSDIIRESKLVICHNDLLESYPWKGYEGDASDKKVGQVVLCDKNISIEESIQKVKSLKGQLK